MRKTIRLSVGELKVKSFETQLDDREISEIYGGATGTCPNYDENEGDPDSLGDGYG